MYNLLIVEDESLIRRGIRALGLADSLRRKTVRKPWIPSADIILT